jgi:hypothetical protein
MPTTITKPKNANPLVSVSMSSLALDSDDPKSSSPSDTCVGNLERGKSNVSLLTIVKLARCLNVKPVKLIELVR